MKIYKITSKYAGKCLNVVGNNVSSLADYDDLSLWEDSGTNEQKWSISSIGTGVYIKSVIDKRYGLNANRYYSPWECDLFKISGNETDAAVNFVQSGNYYKIQLTNYPSYYLTAGGTSNGSSIYWTTATYGDNQLWSVAVVPDDNTENDSNLGQAVNNFNDLANLSEVDVVARCIYSEAAGESLTGKRGVAGVIRNRKNKNSSEFGGGTYKDVVLHSGAFSGMTGSMALCPNTTASAWTQCVEIAQTIDTVSNPVGNCLWFFTNELYATRVYTENGDKKIDFGAGGRVITDEIVIDGHTFFLVEGY